jgi:hypothetical protein
MVPLIVIVYVPTSEGLLVYHETTLVPGKKNMNYGTTPDKVDTVME